MDQTKARAMMEAFQEKWKKNSLWTGAEEAALAEQIDIFDLNKKDGDRYQNILQHGHVFKAEGCLLASEYMQRHYRKLVEGYVPKAYLDDYYHIIDKLTAFPYSSGAYRRTVRSKEYGPWFVKIFELLNGYKLLDFYGCSVAEFLAEQMSEEFKEFRTFMYWYDRDMQADLILAARIDAGDEQVIRVIREMILSDQNTAVISVDVIRAILMSDHTKLHQLLADFLLAAKLQEGIRQAVCENADCGTAEGFQTILRTVQEHNLIRFAAVKRAVAVWTGVCDLDHVDRISEKMLQSIWEAMADFPAKAMEDVKTNDSVRIMCGLWALGFHDVKKAIDVMDEYLRSGTRNQLLTMGYYNTMLQYHEYAYETAAKVVQTYPEDYELLAVFMPTFLSAADSYAFDAVNRTYGSTNDGTKPYKKIPVEELYASREEAYACFAVMRRIYQDIPKKRLEFSPVVFPWYGAYLSKTQLVIRMCVTAYALEDHELMDEACGCLASIDTNENYANRSVYLELLTHQLYSETARRTLLESVADKETYTREAAFRMVKKIALRPEEYIVLEGFLRFKTGEIRRNVLMLLNRQSVMGRLESAGRLLKAAKTELRMGGLTMLQEFHRDESLLTSAEEKNMYGNLIAELTKLENVSESEKVVLDELSGDGKAAGILKEEGYGLYNPYEAFQMPKREEHPEIFQEYFKISPKTLDEEYEKLAKFYVEHGMLEYKTAWGETQLLMNGMSALSYDTSRAYADNYPFKELWTEYYEREIHDARLIQLMYLAGCSLESTELENRSLLDENVEKLIGKTLANYTVTLGNRYESGIVRGVQMVVSILADIYKDQSMYEASREILHYVIDHMADADLWYLTVPSAWQRERMTGPWTQTVFLFHSSRMAAVRSAFRFKNEEEYREWFAVYYEYDKKVNASAHSTNGSSVLDILHYVKAYTLGLIPENEIYKAAFEYTGIQYALGSLSLLLLEKLSPYQKKQLAQAEDPAVRKKAVEVCHRILDKVLDVELARGDLPTVFSAAAAQVSRIYGMNRMVQILVALGKETLDRSTYYYGSKGDSRKVVLSHLLSVCYPNPEDNAKELRKLLDGTKISKERLYETMMYAPQWIDMLEEYLGADLKSGCYYFMAHMNERLDDRKKAVIAKYTPLTEEELNQGAFDVNWFERAYQTLGAETFGALYDAAKYISDGAKHTRARKYADAALNRVNIEELEKTIQDKRNKDLLMSYGIVPIGNEEDALRRYEFIEAFRKESRKFGAQRKASEGIACDMALKNLATSAGYQDVTRLILAMENQLAESSMQVLEEHEVGEVTLKLTLEEEGTAKIICTKNGKQLKSVPAALKKEEYFLYLKEIQTKWKEQYRRTVQMLEQAMEERDSYHFAELTALANNPVTAPIVKTLVYVEGEGEEPVTGLLVEGGLENCRGEVSAVEADTKLRVAHPFDLYRRGCWTEYQSCLFEKMSTGTMKKQPFKQVFRELYVKLPEEREEYSTRMFAGNQIQPQKTVGCLKNRRWIADYEAGLQKVYYKDNLIVRLYALADWFSPSDVEAPTLEWVEFSDRKTFQPVKISDIPDIIYSEVLRDVDLAVSVAHVGGVDPETSHSTIEMREVIIRHNLPLFKLTNVTIEGTHAIIKGSLGSYSIHLGSGVIHELGGHQINALPVHAQSRGKIFLPFVDEDPKTAEIISKIVLFAKDAAIKDPYILAQLNESY